MKGKETPTVKLQEKPPVYKSEIVLFDASSENTVYFPHEHKGKLYRVGHTFKPLNDDRYFQYVDEVGKAANRIAQTEVLETQNFAPQEKLWNELASDRIGYAKNPEDWKERTALFVKANAIKLFLQVGAVPIETEEAEEGELLDDSEELFETKLNCVQNAIAITTSHFWREETREEMDEFLAIQAGAPQKGVLASGVKKTKEQRLCELYDAVCVEQKFYAAHVPAWHKKEMAEQYFRQRFLLLGKSIN